MEATQRRAWEGLVSRDGRSAGRGRREIGDSAPQAKQRAKFRELLVVGEIKTSKGKG